MKCRNVKQQILRIKVQCDFVEKLKSDSVSSADLSSFTAINSFRNFQLKTRPLLPALELFLINVMTIPVPLATAEKSFDMFNVFCEP